MFKKNNTVQNTPRKFNDYDTLIPCNFKKEKPQTKYFKFEKPCEAIYYNSADGDKKINIRSLVTDKVKRKLYSEFDSKTSYKSVKKMKITPKEH